MKHLTPSWRRSLSYRNQFIDLHISKSMDWFLHDKDFRHERVKTEISAKIVNGFQPFTFLYSILHPQAKLCLEKRIFSYIIPVRIILTARKMKFSITDFSIKKSVMENFIFCAVTFTFTNRRIDYIHWQNTLLYMK